MTIVVTNIGTNFSKTVANTTALTVSVPAGGVPAGATIIVGIANSWLSSLGTSDGTNVYTDTLTQGLNNTAASGVVYLSYAENVAALVSGNTISITNNSGASRVVVASAFYVTGLATPGPAIDNTVFARAFGSSTTPSVTAAAVPATAGSLIVGIVGTNGPSGDTFTQDSTHAAYATPPVRVGSSGGAQTSNWCVAGGNVVSSAQLTYAPSITSRDWGAIIVAFAPAASVAYVPYNPWPQAAPILAQ